MTARGGRGLELPDISCAIYGLSHSSLARNFDTLHRDQLAI